LRPNQSSFFVCSIVLGRPLGHICNEENNGKYKAEGSYNNVAHGKEVVLATQHISGGQDKALFAIEGTHGVVVFDTEPVVTSSECIIHLTPKLAEVGQTSGSHPNDEVGVSNIGPLDIFPVSCLKLLSGTVPVLASVAVFEFIFSVGLPSDILIINSDVVVGELIARYAGGVDSEE